MREIRRKRWLYIGLTAVVHLVVVGCAALLLARGVDGSTARSADLRARSGVELLTSVGAKLPDLTVASVQRGLSGGEAGALDRAVKRGRAQGVLTNLTVWDRSGSAVYSDDPRLEGTRPALEAEVRAALTGQATTQRNPDALDLSSHRRTGTLDALEPLRDRRGRVYGALEASLPLQPIVADAARMRSRDLVFLAAAAVALWLLVLPIIARAAGALAQQCVPGRWRTLRAFRRALERDEVELVYQPQVDPRSGAARAVEALVRWRRNGRLLAPDRFLGVVEASPLMAPLTNRVLDLALAQLAAWKKTGSAARISVNLSATDLHDGLPERVAAALERHEVAGSDLTLEVTETAILRDPHAAQRVLEAITHLGVDISVDDFGTGHASISRLYALPISEIKIDKSFVAAPRPHSYLAAIVTFGQQLGLRVVAEGVEDEPTLATLRGLGCDLIQGYHVSRPLESQAMSAWLAERIGVPDPAVDVEGPPPEPTASSPTRQRRVRT